MSEEKTQEAEYWECKSCGVKVDDNSDRKVLPISMGAGEGAANSITFYVCPNCYTIQMPELLFEELHRRMTSRIIT